MNKNINIEEYQKRLCSIGEFQFFGLPMSQVPKAVMYISNLLQLVKPTKILEFGTGRGGLSFLLGTYAVLKNIQFKTYDQRFPQEQFELNIPPIPLLNKYYYDFLNNFFIKKDLREKQARDQIAEEIKNTQGNIIIFCDALKIVEFSEFSPLLKKGDVILVHDYAEEYNGEKWKKVILESGWSAPQESWLERDVEIEGVLNMKQIAEKYDIDYNILSDMENVIWFCGVKK